MRLTRAGAIGVYVIALGGLAAALFVAFVHGRRALLEPHLPWWALAVGFLAAERCVVHLELRRSAHSFSLPVSGRIRPGATGDGLLVGALLGAGTLWALRRVPASRSPSTSPSWGLAASVAVAILRTVAGPSWSRSS